jgi:hypothetical protein
MQEQEEARSDTPEIVWTVTFAAVFKLRLVPGKLRLCVSFRDRNGKWTAPVYFTDDKNVYNELGVDQAALAHVNLRGDDMRLKDIMTATFDQGGDSTTVAKAIHQHKFQELIETIFQGWLKKIGRVKLHKDDSDTYITPDMLTGCYDNSDLPMVRKAFEHELSEDLASHTDREALLAKGVKAFNDFLDLVDEAQEDKVFWYESWEPLASRAGYVILRKGKVVAHRLMIMS